MKKWITLITALLATLLFASSASATYYKDVTYTHWAYQDIQFMTKHRIINGYSTGQFKPGETITRKDAAVMMVRALELEESTSPISLNDMRTTSPGYREVQIALQQEWFSTYEEEFKPNAILTRDEMAKALATAFAYEGNGTSVFTDVPYDHPYYPYIDAILAFEVTEGYNDRTYRPLELVTRAQFSAFLSRVFHQPIAYELRSGGEVVYTDASLDRTIDMASFYDDATIHPQDNRFMNFSQELASANKTDIKAGALIYNGLTENDSFTPAFFNSYLSYQDETGTAQAMFDSFVVLGLRYPGGEFAETARNNAHYRDYQWYIDRTYQQDGALHQLNEAAKMQNRTVDVYLTIPYPKRTGIIEDLNGRAFEVDNYTRSDLARWYVDQMMTRWNRAGFTNINFKGFYWLNETVKVDSDGALLSSLSAHIRKYNKKFVYAPHATSTNFKKWQKYSFDAAFLQPNAFRTATPDKEARLHKAFVNAQIYGSGITLEVNSYGPNQINEGQEAWDLYMSFAERYNLKDSSFLFYQDRDMIHRMRTYDHPTYNRWYKDIQLNLFQREVELEGQ